MHIRLGDPTALAALQLHLERSGVAVYPVGAAGLLVDASADAEELDAQLRFWATVHPRHPVQVLDGVPVAALDSV